MLEEVRITGLGVINDALLELSPGFTALTGETGAGKTMVVTGLGLLFGGRADPSRVRPDAQRASVEGRLRTDPRGKVAQQVEEAGGDLDEDGTLVLTRTVSGEGRSRAFAGGRSVPVSLLTYLADDLVAVHGQSDQQQLLKPGRQRESLDKYAGGVLAEVLADYQRAYGRHRAVRDELTTLTTEARARAAEAEELRAGLTDIEKLNPVAGEEAALRAEEDKLSNADELNAAATTAHEALLGDPTAGTDGADAVTLLGHARRALDAVRRHDTEIDGVAERLSEAAYLISEVAGELATYIQSIDADPARLAAVQERRAVLGRIIRLYGPGGVNARVNGAPVTLEAPPAGSAAPSEADDWSATGEAVPAAGDAAPTAERDDIAYVLAWARLAAVRVSELDNDDETIAELTAAEAELSAQVTEMAGRLSRLRAEAGERFAADVTAELTALAMPHARISVVLTPLSEPGPHGIDDVEIRLASNPGAPALPLHKGASGGELSRVMLAIEVVFAGADPVPTFVFDEVDAGVGGKAAVEIGRRLAMLARLAQVIVVTHLPQVAAFADNHLVVAKSSDGLITSTSVLRLDHEGRVRELSRMLAGLEESEFGQAHAAELLAMAADQASRP
ncbi:DNA repair protein RecN [Trebonia kvetii]|uniref:DNA repair protein RecN n=1 Tax=Trebonia kvetii TaxID=2480626 RepID=A0A6P2BWR9_9ACTN|nr:DNA repair protein RecN [Trebonia kvetii]TVZ03504.1 DNA repair protein RecN [Trebonia kvetii]